MKNKKENGFTLATLLCVIAIISMVCVSIAVADGVYGRSKVTIGTNGTSTYTNLMVGTHQKVLGFLVHYDLAGIDTITVTRVTSPDSTTNSYTNVFQTLVTAATSNCVAGLTNTYLYIGLRYGDMLKFQTTTGTANTGATVHVEHESQQF